LVSFTESLKKSKKQIYFSVVKAHVYEILKKTHVIENVGSDHFFNTTQIAMEYLLKQINNGHKHTDRQKCPLSKYIEMPVEAMHPMKSRRDLIAYYYRRLVHAKVLPAYNKIT
jgi:hypothetical protein